MFGRARGDSDVQENTGVEEPSKTIMQ